VWAFKTAPAACCWGLSHDDCADGMPAYSRPGEGARVLAVVAAAAERCIMDVTVCTLQRIDAAHTLRSKNLMI
jgi:hypothetical protein